MPTTAGRRAALALLVTASLPAAAARELRAQDRYQQPPAAIRQILDAEPTPFTALSPTRDRMLLLSYQASPPIADVAAPFLGLAGLRVNPRSFTPSAPPTYTAVAVRDVAGGGERAIRLPARTTLFGAMWSRDARHVALVVRSDTGVTLWVADPATGATRQLTRWALNASLGNPCAWATDSQLLCRMVVPNRKAPQPDLTPVGPVVQESGERAAPAATYQDLLRDRLGEQQLDHYLTSQLAAVSLTGAVKAIGKPDVYVTARPSPDGRWVLTQAVHRPYSYRVPIFYFPTRTELLAAADGAVVRTLADVPLQEAVGWSPDATTAGLREPTWRADVGATVVWTEALDGGDPSKPAARRDRVLSLAAPFAGEPTTLAETAMRSGGIVWGRGDLALLSEFEWKTRKQRTWIIDPSAPSAAPRQLFDNSMEDRYGDPGQPVTGPGPLGTPVLLTTADGASIYLSGLGASPEGDRPFLDRLNLRTLEKERLFRSEAPYFEGVSVVLDPAARRVITRRQSAAEPPNLYVRDLAAKTATAITGFKDPAPSFAGVTKQLITYKRADGVQLSATLYLPAGYDKSQGPLPFFFWAYPQEFKTASAASQVTGSPHLFVRPSGASHLFLLTQGYGVLDGPTMPIVGEGDREPNDSYVEQLVASARAAVDKVVEMGVADRGRIAVGGHSYGAFMTANLLAHSNLFAAGIARSGAYNRTLTPFGFQAEERNYWKASDVYTRMSPFTYADSVSAPLLLIHGTADNNTGTFPIQSERFYAALAGLGKKVRLVMLPGESHGYRARESNGHVLYEMVTWLDRYLKPKPKA